ncbi:MAG: DUF1638 domain-containing protein [Gammaproteobacteria bacterium]
MSAAHAKRPAAGGARVLVIACGALAHDLVRVRQANHWEHLDIQCLPAELHNYPQRITPAVREKIHAARATYQHIFVAYADCGSGGALDRMLAEEGIERLPGSHCYETFAGAKKFAALHEAELGSFYLTDFLARHFQRIIVRGLGLDRHPELRDIYFAHYKKLVFLDQTGAPELAAEAVRAARFLGLEYQHVATGDAELRAALRVTVPAATAPAATAPNPA